MPGAPGIQPLFLSLRITLGAPFFATHASIGERVLRRKGWDIKSAPCLKVLIHIYGQGLAVQHYLFSRRTTETIFHSPFHFVSAR